MTISPAKQSDQKLLIVIPARGGSKGIPKKNLQRVGGKSLVIWSIEAAKMSTLPSVVVVSTDDSEIMKEARTMNVMVLDRPTSLSGDNSPTELTMEHALMEVSKNHIFSHIVLLQPTTPIRRKSLVDDAFAKLIYDDSDSIVGVVKRSPFFWRGPVDDSKPLFDPLNRPMRQEVLEGNYLYQETGNIYISKIKNFQNSKCRMSGKISLFLLTDNEGLDIDTQEDLVQVDLVLRGYK